MVDSLPTVRYIDIMESETKDIIFNRAISLFAFKGYESMSVQQICETCEVSKPTLYYYFESKLGLFKEIFAVYGAELYESINRAFVISNEFPECLSCIFENVLSFSSNHPAFFSLFYSLSTSSVQTESGRVYSDFKRQIDSLFLKIFEKYSEIFGNMKGYEGMYSRIFQSTLYFSVFSNVTNSLDLDKATIHKLVQTFLWGVAN